MMVSLQHAKDCIESPTPKVSKKQSEMIVLNSQVGSDQIDINLIELFKNHSKNKDNN